MAQAQTQHRRLIIGGDFNTQLGIGIRGDMLNQIQSGYSIKCANNSDIPWEHQWTFCSALGAKRKIDFVFVSNTFQTADTTASSDIDLKSNHRCVKTIMVVRKRVAQIKQTAASTKGWRPCMDAGDNRLYYQQMLDDKMNADFRQNLENAERIIYEAATTDGVRIMK